MAQKPIRLGNSNDIIRLRPKKKKFATVGEQLRKIETLPQPIRTLASPKLTGALATGLGLLTGVPVLRSIGVGLAIPTVAGVVKASPKAEKFAKERFFTPEKFGQRIGEVIEDPKKIFPKKETVKDIAKTAGLVGAGAVGGAVIPKIIEKVKQRKQDVSPIVKDMLSPQLIPSQLGAVPTPVGAKTPTPQETEKVTPVTPMDLKVNVKVSPKNYLNVINQVI